MSQTVITQSIDGIEVVKGFGKLAIDPFATKEVVAVSIQSTDEFKAVKEKQDARNEAAHKASQEHTKMKVAKNKSDKDKAWRACETHRNMAASFESEIKERLPALKKKRQNLMIEQAVYFEPKAGEYMKTDVEISTLSDVLASVQGSGFVDLDGNVLEDNRGAVYCVLKSGKWSITKIVTIGVKIPSSGILYGDLDADKKKAVDFQVETNAAAVMSAGEKAQAKQAAESKALLDAERLKGQLDIQSAPDALEQSQAWYESRMTELDLIYG